MVVGIYTRAEDGPRTIRQLHSLFQECSIIKTSDDALADMFWIEQALTAREVIEISPSSQGRFSVKVGVYTG